MSCLTLGAQGHFTCHLGIVFVTCNEVTRGNVQKKWSNGQESENNDINDICCGVAEGTYKKNTSSESNVVPSFQH